jgi:hypothetical protein
MDHYLARIQIEERRRQAEQHRLARQFRPAVSRVTRVRGSVGNWLIGAGERLAPRPTTETVSSPC